MSLSPAQFERVLELNNQFQKETSFLQPDDLQRLIDRAYSVETKGELDAFLITMSHNSPHDGINFSWFKKRYESFAYIDRIVTAPHARGRGLAKALYLELMAQAKNDGIEMVCCEINDTPPNPGSVAFHQKLGFEMVDTAPLSADKTVGYWIRKL
jgi:predicted GNAT superfamily acetyltransferase